MNRQLDLEQFAPATDLELDAGIRRAVLVLRSAGIETFESCQGGPGHAFPDPTVKFHGSAWEGYRACGCNGTRFAGAQNATRLWRREQPTRTGLQ